MSVKLLAGCAALVASIAAGDQNTQVPIKPDSSQEKQIEALRERLAESMRQQKPGPTGPYSGLFGIPPGTVVPQHGDAVTREQAVDAAPEKTIVCGMTVWHARVDPDPRIRIAAPHHGEFRIQKIVPPVCTGATDTERGAVLTPRRR